MSRLGRLGSAEDICAPVQPPSDTAWLPDMQQQIREMRCWAVIQASSLGFSDSIALSHAGLYTAECA